MKVIELHNVNKSYGGVTALTGVSFSVENGELFGLIGPDGAGKTSLFRILTTLLVPETGKAIVLGRDVVEEYKLLRPKLGYMPGKFSLYEDLSVSENLEFFASVFGTTVEQNYQLIAPIYSQIEPFKDRKAGQLSGGMKQKLALSCALIHRPELLILDEPTTGVDAVSRKEFWGMLRRLKEQGITIVVSTPYMDEASLCDRVALIHNGKILSIGTPSEIALTFQKPLFAVKGAQKYQLIRCLREYEYSASVQPFGDTVHYTDTRKTPDKYHIQKYLSRNGIEDVEIERIDAGIEDVFISLMKPENQDG